MPIVFAPRAPIETMQQEAQAKSAYDQSIQERDFAFKQDVAQASINNQLRDDANRRAAMAQSAYQFEASRQPSARDAWAAEQSAARDERNFEQQIAGLTQSENVRMQRLQRQIDYVQEQSANGVYTPEETQELLAKLHGTHGPLALRHQASQEQAMQLQMRRADDMHAREVARLERDSAFRARNPQERLQTLNLPDGSTANFLEDSQGNLHPVVNRTLAEEVAERKMLGGQTRREIRNGVMDQYRDQMAGIGELSDAGITELVGQDKIDREVEREIQQRAQQASVAEQRQNVTATAQENNRRQYISATERDLTAYNQGVPKKPGDPTPQRPLWVQAYLNQLSPLQRAAADVDALFGPDKNAPVPPEVLLAAQEWHINQRMQRQQRQGQNTGQQGGEPAQTGTRETGAAPDVTQGRGRDPGTPEEAVTFRREALTNLNRARESQGMRPLPDDSEAFGRRFELNRARSQVGLPEVPFGTQIPVREQSNWRNLSEGEIMRRLTPEQQQRWRRAQSLGSGRTGRSVLGSGDIGIMSAYYDRQLDKIWAEAQ